MHPDDVRNQVRRFVEEHLLGDLDPAELTDDASFERLHLTDSVRALDVILFVEQTFGVTVENHEALPENFDSIQNVTAFVKRKLEAG